MVNKHARVLIIYNFTKHLIKLTKLIEASLDKPKIEVVRRTHVAEIDDSKFDLIIITGGNGRKLLFDEQKLRAQRSIIKNSKTPIIGICFGAEIIALTYGGELAEMEKVRRYYVPITFTRESLLAPEDKHIKVYEGHKIKINQLPSSMEVLATSKDGIEVFKHRSKKIYGLQFHPEVTGRYDHGAIIFERVIKSLTKTSVKPKKQFLSKKAQLSLGSS